MLCIIAVPAQMHCVVILSDALDGIVHIFLFMCILHIFLIKSAPRKALFLRKERGSNLMVFETLFVLQPLLYIMHSSSCAHLMPVKEVCESEVCKEYIADGGGFKEADRNSDMVGVQELRIEKDIYKCGKE
jgi:hypothetical protein